ncbi:hypothetical protein, partial [Rivihabitans pingtungensis]|jgi:hypothetical protein|uniref:hypothetical protein n=1 Tax=Rivihabitans pingtungensis TaxID=1054498 RepID=UPI002D00896A
MILKNVASQKMCRGSQQKNRQRAGEQPDAWLMVAGRTGNSIHGPRSARAKNTGFTPVDDRPERNP